MSIHESLVKTEDSSINIETSAEVIKPVFAYASKLVDECKVNLDSDGLSYTAVDPANVAMIGMEVSGDAFETFDVDPTVLGTNLSSLKGSLRAGRQRQGDTINLSVNGDRLATTVHRDYDGTEMDLQNSIRLIDPDSIRQEPEIPDLGLPATATVPRKLLEDVVTQVDEYSDYLSVSSEGEDLVFDGMSEGNNTEAAVSGVVDNDEDDVESQLSLDYIKDAVKAFKKVGVDDLTLKFGQEFPIRIEFETEFNGAEVTGWWFQAPRVQRE